MSPSFEEYDGAAWDHGDEIFKSWKKTLYNKDLYYEIAATVKKHQMGGRVIEVCAPQKGAFNVHYRVRFVDDTATIIRFPIPAYFKYAEEKLLAEVATMRYISDTTTIPMPFVLHHGLKEESPGGLGPFIVMEWVESAGDMADRINTPGLGIADVPILDPNVDEARLEHVYGQMAGILLQLYKCKHSVIGSLGFPQDSDEPEVTGRPLSLNIAQLANFARVPHFSLPPASRTFETSSDYYIALSDMHLQQLSFQRNQAVDSADDCRKKYIARQLFRKLARENRLADQRFDRGPFPLWCDDLRPANVLMNQDDNIAAVIDWEFSHSAPAEFLHSPPWWLLLQAPEDWRAGLDDWVAKYEPRLATFLRALESRERQSIHEGLLKKSDILSTRMRESWESGQFWLTYAARRSWAFDAIYWKFLDEKYFGENKSGHFEERLNLLSPRQVMAMEGFVARKLEEKAQSSLVDWYESGSEARLPENIFDAD